MSEQENDALNINLNSRAVEKLIDYTASGIGSTASFVFSRMMARRDAEAKLIAAEGESKAKIAEAKTQADTMRIISKAQADARSTIISSEAVVGGEVTFGDLVEQRIQFQEQKRQSNIESVVQQAALELEDKEVQDDEVDHDWTARFFNDVQDVSSEEMQQIWAKVLVGEVERSGSTSIKTIGILKNLDKGTADLFRKLCSICVSISPDGGIIMDARIPALGGDAGTNALQKYGLSFDNLNVLNEHDLIISDYNSSYDYKMSVGIPLPGQAPPLWLRFPFRFQGRSWVLVPIKQRWVDKEFRLSGVALAQSDRELSRVVEIQPMKEYLEDFKKFLGQNDLNMAESGIHLPHQFQVPPE